jgi:hypothetical protein
VHTLTNAVKQQRVETHDVQGQLVTAITHANDGLTLDTTTQFVHDPFGNLVQTGDPGSNVITIAYDMVPTMIRWWGIRLMGRTIIGIALLPFILRRTRRGDNRRIHNRAALNRDLRPLQHLSDLREQPFVQLMPLQQSPKFKDRGRVWHRLSSQINFCKLTQYRNIVQRFFTRKVGHIEPVLKEMNAQHPLQANRWSAISFLRIVGFNHRTQIGPRHNLVHRYKKFLATRQPPMLPKSRSLIRCHRQSLLFHSLRRQSCALNL